MTKEEKLERIESMERELKVLKDDLENDFDLPSCFKDYDSYTRSFIVERRFIISDIIPDFFTKKLYAQLKLRYIADKLNDGWVPDWDDEEEIKHHLSCHDGEWRTDAAWEVYLPVSYFESEFLALKALKIMGDDMDLLRS